MEPSFFSFLQAKMLQKYEKKLDKINYIKYNFLISYRNVTAIKPVIKKLKE